MEVDEDSQQRQATIPTPWNEYKETDPAESSPVPAPPQSLSPESAAGPDYSAPAHSNEGSESDFSPELSPSPSSRIILSDQQDDRPHLPKTSALS